MTQYTDYYGPEGLRTRGTIVVVPGRGEGRAAYARFGRRLAADAYRVRVVDAPRIDADDLTGSLARFGAGIAAAVGGTAAEDGVVRPVVLVGADTGAAAVAALLGQGESPVVRLPEAVVLAGLPGRGADTDDTDGTDGSGNTGNTGAAEGAGRSWEDELDVRTFCPAHRAVLTDDSGTQRGSLGTAVPDALLDAAHQGDIAVPTLILVGDADPLADRDALTRTAKSLSRGRLAVVRDAHHDVLNDLQHRSVAAEVVTFLETVRNTLVPVVTVESSAW
ncbi:alpha/beta hydrolase [Streptomyces sp. NBC_01571]|uniref:alpha/beta hydrolase n=1 Tax=Streptomyces sp. NBC_01571 TaxID=2975883 RepID=UPI0022559A05|nr:alpha/beta hydrolase [Streptomyces sp. NBC_01571]MCX4580038.1 alpha/beta hydrolase [Streptomyces sp. NBC_01571]